MFSGYSRDQCRSRGDFSRRGVRIQDVADEALGQRRTGITTMVRLADDGNWRLLAMVSSSVSTSENRPGVARQDQ